jgi:acetyl-CoA carboxylase biotin carboxyl carrier protein
MSEAGKLDLDLARRALEIARARGLAEIELESGDDRFFARLGPRKPKRGPLAPVAVENAEPELPREAMIRASLVGYFRPRAAALVPGDRVEAEEIIGSISALGISTEIEAGVAGTVTEVRVEPNEPVEYGQVLAVILP